MNRHRFAVFEAESAEMLETALNEWVASAPEGTKIRRTQLAAAHTPAGFFIVALVNYEEPPPAKPCAHGPGCVLLACKRDAEGACVKCGGRWQHQKSCPEESR